MIVALFTGSYPYDVTLEKTFLETEINYLASAFDRLIIVPQKINGDMYPVPRNVDVDESYAALLRKTSEKLQKAISSSLLYKDIFLHPRICLYFSAIKRLIGFSGDAELTRKWLLSFIENRNLDTSKVIFYTYWFDQTSLGIGLAKNQYPQIKLISRAHGSDLYPERHSPAYIPCRELSLKLIERLYPDSEKGVQYINSRFPWFSPSCQVARLGVKDPGFVTPSSRDGIFRIVSCSPVVPVKRLGLLLEGIHKLALQRSDLSLVWHHFGEGLQKRDIEERARVSFPRNVRFDFPGYPSKEILMEFYKNNPVDVFMNVSESEGTPVAIMEAISCGIPVIATAVGGNAEIVTKENGILLNGNPSPDDIAFTIMKFMGMSEKRQQMSAGSRRVWKQKYDADVNYSLFVQTLIGLIKQ